MTGTPTCLQLDATFAATNTLTGNESFIRCENVGATKIAGFLLDLVSPSTDMLVASATEANYAYAVRCRLNGTVYWMMFASASG
jgi:hypothetical protein